MVGGRDGEATEVIRVVNAAATPLRYEMDPQGQFNALKEIEDGGNELLAIYHSHTKSAAYPSQTDVNQAVAWPDQIYVIVSLADEDAPDVKAYLLKDLRIADVDARRPVATSAVPITRGAHGGGGDGGARWRRRRWRWRRQAGQGRLRPQPGRSGDDPGPAREAGMPSVLKRGPRLRRAGVHGGRPARRAGRLRPRPEGARPLLADTITENESDEEAELRDEARLRAAGRRPKPRRRGWRSGSAPPCSPRSSSSGSSTS